MEFIDPAGITLPGNAVRMYAPAEFRLVVLGSYMTIRVPLDWKVLEKFPARSRAVGMVPVKEPAEESRSPSYDTKKKVLLRPLKSLGMKTGPPRVPPNWFLRKAGLSRPALLPLNPSASMSLL